MTVARERLSNTKLARIVVALSLAMVAVFGTIVIRRPLTSEPIARFKSPLASHPALRTRRDADESDDFFARTEVLRIHLQLSEPDAQKLREDERTYVRCELRENDGEPLPVGVKLKGAAGSFRELDDRPALTLKVDKYRKKQQFHRLRKFYLNNSVQDESYYSEWLCASICRELKLPTPRIAFAHVWLNDRDLGLYVLKEGFDETFLARHFKDASGSLYDGGFLQDVDVDLEKDTGIDLEDLTDLQQLRAACQLTDAQLQRSALQNSLDLDAFLTFMAFEMMAGHWDGYVANQNNYRLYIPANGRAWFLPHGMDQMFQDSAFSVFEPRMTLVTRAVRGQTDWNERYRDRVRQILPCFEPDKLIASLEQLEARIRPELIKIDPQCAPARDELLNQWRERLTQRYASIVEQLEQPDPPPPVDQPSDDEPLRLAEGESVSITDLYERQEIPTSILMEVESEPTVYRIEVGDADDCIASWRRTVRLLPGTYVLAAEVRGASIAPRSPDDRGAGAGLRISGASRQGGVVGTTDWQTIEFSFNVVGELENSTDLNAMNDEDLPQVELVFELRATAGWAEMHSPALTRMR